MARHGTRSCYVQGCREAACTEANAAYERDRRWDKYRPKVFKLREMSPTEVAWLAGLMEGEGSFIVMRVAATERQKARIRVRLSLQMTDQDVVQRVADTVGLGNVHAHPRQQDHHKDTYVWTISRMKPVVELVRLVLPLMGSRRTDQINAMLAAVDEAGGPARRQRRHGTSKYQYDGCRCETCTSAKAAANARRYAAVV
ncbi:LAGLIDADG family homing endonuclease [Micromonospora sp. 050-3]|uniref:LAGLIDADG family homing endonuclease n=1 Tax=Micromonospora sp. 050-3 TaxID=2789265 RepID=UPI00397B6F0A